MHRQTNIFDKIGSLLPGYQGYNEREGRRQCDKVLRERVAIVLSDCQRVVEARLADSVKARDFAQLNALEDCRKSLDTLAFKVAHAPYGVSAFFSDTQIREGELAEIYRMDLDILEKATALAPAAETIALSVGIAGVARALETRNQYIMEMK
ncbi:MAG: hypothetical protein WCK47_15135 [bacterium]